VVGQLSSADFTQSFGNGKGPSMTDRPLLPDELIHPRLSNLAAAIGA
jgi:hypothetical protein